MAEVIKITYQLRRGNASVWAKNNPILSRGEPGFVIDENRLKIGDGITAWNDLDYIGESNIFNAATYNGFPSVGSANVIYKAEEEKAIYQWNTSTLKYELLGSTGDIPIADIENLGIVKSSNADNGIFVAEDGTMKVNNLNINKLIQNEGDYIELYGGSASDII